MKFKAIKIDRPILSEDVCLFLLFVVLSVGEQIMHFLEEIRKWIGEIIEISLLLVAFGVIAEILFGNNVPFFGGIVANLTGLVNILGENGLVGLIVLGVIVFLIHQRKTLSPENPQ